MNCMITEAEVSRGKTHQKVSGQITSHLKGLVGPGLGQRRKKKRGETKGEWAGSDWANFKTPNVCMGELCSQRKAVIETFLCPWGHHHLSTQAGIRK